LSPSDNITDLIEFMPVCFKIFKTTQNGRSNPTFFYSIAACVGLDIDRHRATYAVINEQVKTTECNASSCFVVWDPTSFSVNLQ
jgi:hypothetical protein